MTYVQPPGFFGKGSYPQVLRALLLRLLGPKAFLMCSVEAKAQG